MDLQLRGKRALVTGSSAGIGAAIARSLAHEGVCVVVHGRDAGRAETVANGIKADGGEARVALGDLAVETTAARVIEESSAAFGGIDVLINNAGGYEARDWFETTPQTWCRFYEQDVLPAVRLIQAFAPAMRSAGWGRIVNLATGLASSPQPMMADYAAAKAALANATVSLAKSLTGSGVGVCTVSPGLIRTTGVEEVLRTAATTRGWGNDWQEIQARWFDEVLGSATVKRLGTVEEVAALVTFLSSPLADYVHGANVRIDGGLVPTVN